jgi:N-acetylmuramoyl-L-alanine amidase
MKCNSLATGFRQEKNGHIEPLHFTGAFTIVKPSLLGHDFFVPVVPAFPGICRFIVSRRSIPMAGGLIRAERWRVAICVGIAVAFLVTLFIPTPVSAAGGIIDYQDKLPRRFRKHRRHTTDLIIVHSTESGLSSALRTISKGGLTNYLVARDGRIYRMLHHPYRANHAGLSMWNGHTNLSNRSVGVELVGYSDRPFSDAQYRSLRRLLEELQRIYHIPDERVLEHYRVAYGTANPWIKRPHRGRKRDPGVSNFSRVLAGLTNPEPQTDPDVAAGRLLADPEVLTAQAKWKRTGQPQRVAGTQVRAIGPTQTAWDVAGSQYNRPTTVYTFPDGRRLRGDQIRNWSRMPAGTRVTIGQTPPVRAHVVTTSRTPWQIAGAAYNSSRTHYTFPNGRTLRGDQIKDWSRIPPGTKVVLASSRS